MINNKSIYTRFHILILLAFLLFNTPQVFAQYYAGDLSLEGEAGALCGEKLTYQLDISGRTQFSDFQWQTDGVFPDGRIPSNTTTQTQIYWNQAGVHEVKVYYKDWYNLSNTYVATVIVHVSDQPVIPDVPTVIGTGCNSVTLKRNDPTPNITWYWQSSNTGTSIENSSPTITLTSGNEYFLRAKNNITHTWSEGSSKIEYQRGAYTKWYADNDGDGLGSPFNYVSQCQDPSTEYIQYVENDDDYNDGTPDFSIEDGILPNSDHESHWTHQISYDTKGIVTGVARTYFDESGKPNVSLSKDIVTKKVWGTETTYDNFGRSNKSSFIAPSGQPLLNKVNFFKPSSEVTANTLPANQSIVGVSSSQTIQVSYNITANGTVNSGLNVNFIAGNSITLNPDFTFTPGTSGSFTASIVPVPATPNNTNISYYSNSNSWEVYQATAEQPYSQINYDKLNPGNVINVTGGNKINGEWKTGHSYTIPAAQEMYYVFGSEYFTNSNDIEPYSSKLYPQYDNLGLSAYFLKVINSQSDVLPVESIPGSGFNIMTQLGAYPYALKVNYSLERGKLYKVVIAGQTKIVQVYNEINFRKANEVNNVDLNNPVTIIAGNWSAFSEINTFNLISDVVNNPNYTINDLKCLKTIQTDLNGIENVAFNDSDGKILATARSGGPVQNKVTSLIGAECYIDIHLPTGCEGTLSYIGGSALYKVFNLKTGDIVYSPEKDNLKAGVYRIELAYKIPELSLSYIDKTNGTINNISPTAKGVTYNVNYFDYSINLYNKTGQLIKSIQPKGYIAGSTILATPSYLSSSDFTKNYTYNSTGQVAEATSIDEGTSQFAYRKDGQIRYSQNSEQAESSLQIISYTNYDSYGRPIESGQLIGADWEDAKAGADTAALISATRLGERSFSVYDETNNTSGTQIPTPYSITIPSNLTLAVLAPSYIQKNLAGNVAVTYNTRPAFLGSTIISITWYSYDIYGRTEWIVQYNEEIGVKTIDYEYDYKGNVKKVTLQKSNPLESFVHQYTYDANDVLKKVETATHNTPFTTHADYSYYLTGELKRINIAQGLQGIDYVYTLGGQLKSINHPSLEEEKDPGGDANDIFGLTLDYYNGDYVRAGSNITSSPTIGADYNGNIKAARWANKAIADDYSGGIANQKGYLYNYNRNNWLTDATFGNANSNNAIITPAPNGKYKEGGLSYDPNGNIKTLVRTNASGTTQDTFTYNYHNGKNQLSNVSDTAANNISNTDIDNQQAGNYEYNAIGQMIRDNQQNLEYEYNAQGLVSEISKLGNTYVKFYYNERGQRIKKVTHDTNGDYAVNNIDYYVLDLSGNVMAIYNYKPFTSGIIQKDLPIFGLGRLGVFNRATGKTSYEITDHLGNVRAVIQKTDDGQLVTKSFADYYPFGELLPGRNASDNNYRYAFQGQELDNETGMEAFQLRLWEGRLGRWLSPDPYGQYSSPYLGMGNNPLGMIDSDGGFARWFKWDISWAAGVGIDEIKLSKYFKGSLNLDFFNIGTNSDSETNVKFLSGKIGLTFNKYGGEVTADGAKVKFNNKKTLLGIPVNYQESTFLAFRSSASAGKYELDGGGIDSFSHKAGEGWQSPFQYVPGNTLTIAKHLKLSDNYDVGGSFKIYAVDIEAGINFKELGEDIKKGMRDLGHLLRDGWGPFFRPVFPEMNTNIVNTNTWRRDK